MNVKEKKKVSESNCAQWILVTLSSKFIAKELDTHSFSWFCSYRHRSKVGGWERRGGVKEDQADENQTSRAGSQQSISDRSRETPEKPPFVFVDGDDPICMEHWSAFRLSISPAWFLSS